MWRTIAIQIDNRSWRRRVPREIAVLTGKQRLDLRIGLLHTAHRTRPSYLHGFHLSDQWAWMRYAYAFSPSSSLRLRAEWSELDPHQKTILSDDLGMGLTTQILAEKLGIQSFHDTLHYIKIARPKSLSLISVAKNGAAKTPDFVALDNKGRIILLECKGSQSSHAALRKAMEAGKLQKGNVTSASSPVYRSLVMGLFIPQHNSSQSSIIRISDPDWEDVKHILSNLSEEEKVLTSMQLETAKMFSFLSLPNTANSLFSTPLSNLSILPNNAIGELNIAVESLEDDSRVVTSPRLDRDFGESTDASPPISASARLHGELFDLLLTKQDIRTVLLDEYLRRRESKWISKSQDHEATLNSPFGLQLIFKATDSK